MNKQKNNTNIKYVSRDSQIATTPSSGYTLPLFSRPTRCLVPTPASDVIDAVLQPIETRNVHGKCP